MAKINEYPQAVTINNNDLFVIDQESGGDHATKSASVSQIADKATSGVQTQIGDLSDLTTSVTSSIVGAVNSLNSASLKASELRVIRETKTTNSNGTIDSNSLTGGAIPLSRTILSAYSPSGYFVKIGYYSSRYTFDVYDSSFQLVRNTAVEVCIVSTADLTK